MKVDRPESPSTPTATPAERWASISDASATPRNSGSRSATSPTKRPRCTFPGRHARDRINFPVFAGRSDLQPASAPPTRPELTFGVFFFDSDLDGRLDIFAANGHLESGHQPGAAQPALRTAASIAVELRRPEFEGRVDRGTRTVPVRQVTSGSSGPWSAEVPAYADHRWRWGPRPADHGSVGGSTATAPQRPATRNTTGSECG